MLFEWRLQDIERTANEAARKSREIDTLSGDVDRLERTNRELSSKVVRLCLELQTIEERLAALEQEKDHG